MTEKKKENKTLEQKVDELTKQIALLNANFIELCEKSVKNCLTMFDSNLNAIKQIIRTNEKYNAKLRRRDQNQVNFFRWWGIILICFYTTMIFLRWYLN